MSIDRYAVIGDPIEHSLSPAMQEAGFLSADMTAVYEAHRVSPEMLGPHVACLRYGYRGFNVTVPHKEAILQHLDEIDDDARALGAVNTVVVRDTALRGYNTDAIGFGLALESAGCNPRGISAVVFGAGGSARAAVAYLNSRARRISVVNRDRARAERLVARYDRAEAIAVGEESVATRLEEADLVVNATPLGMGQLSSGNPLPAHACLRGGALAFDLVYGQETPFLRQAAESGCRTVDGLEMLVRQGAASFTLWTGREPDVRAMRAACEREMERRRCFVS